MRSRFWFFVSIITLLALFVSSFSLNGSSSAAGLDFQPQTPESNLRVVRPVFVGQSQPLRSLRVPEAREPGRFPAAAVRSLRDRLAIPKTLVPSSGSFDESIVQDRPGRMNMPAPVANFEGVANVNGVLPPDTQGDIGFDPATGKKYYVQWVNLSFEIWDVTNPAAPAVLLGPIPGSAIWSGSGTICASHNDGDPITQFDHLANRWLMSQFALSFPNNFHQCIAVSATADPTGAWYLYDYQTSTTMMNDYPKFGVWPDGYYMTVNQFDGVTSAWGGAGVAVFERSAMLSGLSARMIYIDVGAVTLAYGGMLPSDLDGPAPAAGTPNYFMEWDDSSWQGDPTDTLRIWEFKTDWANPLNTTFGANLSYDPNYTVTTSDVDPDLCGYSRSCIPQPGTAQGLDAISDRLMYRLQYRDFGGHQTLLTNHTVDSNGADHAGVHWIELRDTGSGWSLYQDGVYAPDADHRWMASAAMDDSGDIALGFSVSSSLTYPSIRYTGRLTADPLGSLPQGEASIIAGSGSQTHSAARWGDYSMMALDPTDGCTFWYTQEYMAVTSSASWQTRVGSFKFPSCSQLAAGKLTGTVTDGANPIEGAAITLSGGIMTVTNADGEYALVLPAGDYSVTASKFSYGSDTANVTIVADQTTVQDFNLALAPTHTVSGVVTDSSTHWPLYARIDILGYPDGPVFSDPVTGFYSAVLPEWTYDFSVSALSGGYLAAIASVPVFADVTQDFELDADLDACAAPGYFTKGFVQDFETWPLSGWTVVDNTAGGLVWDSSAAYGDGNYTGGRGQAADVNSDFNIGIPYDTELISPVIDAMALPSLVLSYKANFQIYSGLEALDLDISEDGGSTWKNISRWTTSHGTRYSQPGEDVSVDLSPFISLPYPFPGAEANFQLRWHYYTTETAPWDYYAQVDQVAISKSCVQVPDSGLVVGAVYDENTDLAVADPSVEDSTGAPALLIDTSLDLSQPNPIYVINEPGGSSVDLTASALGYGSDTRTPAVVAGGTVRQDFNLPAGLLSADPEQMIFNVTVPAPTESLPLTLENEGGLDLDFHVFAIPGDWLEPGAPGPFADHTRHTGPKNLNDRDAQKLRVDLTPKDVTVLPVGGLIASWDTGLVGSWGIGFNHDETDLWVGNITLAGGDDLDYRFLPDGTLTGDTIDTTIFRSVFAADMAYNPFTRTLWQVNVGSDSCVYELDPAAMAATGRKICPPFGTSERGLAFDPLTNTYYAGSWNDGIVNHFKEDGTLIDSAAVNLSISGLAFNPATGHLFALTNHAVEQGLFDVYVLDVGDSYSIVGAFNLTDGSTPVFLSYNQAGLELDCDGNLWAVDQGLDKVYVAETGETGVCDWQAGWLSAAPDSGSVASSGSTSLSVSVDATGMPRGAYQAYLRVANDTPYGALIVPVTMNVVNTPPTANSQSVTTDEDVPLAITLTGGDPDGDSLTYTVTQNPAHGALSGSAPNLVYTPFTNYNGSDSLKFRVNDGQVNSSIATVSITISPVDDPPVIVNVPENTTFVTTVEATDPEHDELSFSITGGADQALFDIDEITGALSFKSPPDFEVPLDSDGDNVYVVVVSVSDGLLSDSQTFHVVVTDEVEVVITQIYLPVIAR